MPDLVATAGPTDADEHAPPEYLADYLPPEDEASVDPVETMRYVAKRLESIPEHMSDLPRGLYAAIIMWAERTGVIPPVES